MPLIAMATPLPNILYTDEDSGECGYIWGGDEYVQYGPVDGRWEEDRMLLEEPNNPQEACEALGLHYVGELESVEMYTDLGEDLIVEYGDGKIAYGYETYWEYLVGGVLILGVAFFVWRRRG